MTASYVIVRVLLVFVAACCTVGVLGMVRMREPIQALHYVGLPASVGVVALAAAVWVEKGPGQLSLKTTMIAAVLLAINSVTAHAIARAFRVRETGRKS